MKSPWHLAYALIAIGFAGLASAAASSRLEYQATLDLKPDIERGRVLFASCTACHQADGNGVASKGVPGIAGQHYRVLVEQLAHFRADERPELRMTHFAAERYIDGAQDLVDVSAYVSRLAPKATSSPGPSTRLVAGARIYADHCSRCHGEQGEGDALVRFPRVGGQHYSYLLRQLDALRLGDRDRRSWDHMELLTPLSRSQMRGLAASLARMRPAPAETHTP